MKLITALAAGLALGLIGAAPAAAQDRHDQNTMGNRTDQTVRGDRDRGHDQNMTGNRTDRTMRGDRDRHDGMRGDRGRDHRGRGRDHGDHGHHHGWRHHHCHSVWRHHHRHRVC